MLEYLVLAQLETAGFNLTTHGFEAVRGTARVTLSVQNNSGRDAQRVFVDCALLDKAGQPVEVVKAIIPNVRSGSLAHAKAEAVASPRFATASCRVSQVTF